MTTVRFVHISDTHVGPTPDYELWGYRPYAMLEALVEHIHALPFSPDFVLHTGDITQDASDDAYRLAFSALKRLNAPLYCLTGNHDHPDALSLAWLGEGSGSERLDYSRTISGIRLLVYDTRGPARPGERLPMHAAGMLTDAQLAHLREQCASADGNPLILALHHQPIKLDSRWLDEGFDDDGVCETMMLECADEFLEAIAPARGRICGVFFGHVHRGFQVIKDGILFCSAPSALLQFKSYPGQTTPIKAQDELPGFNLVTIQDGQTTVRGYTFARPTPSP